MNDPLVHTLANALAGRRNADGGFGPRPGESSEAEPTALAALALDDQDARSWLEAHQSPDGSFSFAIGSVVNDAATGLAAFALAPGRARERALDHLERTHARTTSDTVAIPHDASVFGWSWTEDTFGWVEPTARALLALRRLRPAATGAIADGLALLRDREAVGGGWNYGNRIVLGEDLPPYAQTTAVALLSLRALDADLERRGLRLLRRLWREERDGGLSTAMSAAALRLAGDPDGAEALRWLGTLFERTAFLHDSVALAWAVIAAGPALAALEQT